MSNTTTNEIRKLYLAIMTDLSKYEDDILAGQSYSPEDCLDPNLSMPVASKFHYCIKAVHDKVDGWGSYDAVLRGIVEQHCALDYGSNFQGGAVLLKRFYELMHNRANLKELSPYIPPNVGSAW